MGAFGSAFSRRRASLFFVAFVFGMCLGSFGSAILRRFWAPLFFSSADGFFFLGCLASVFDVLFLVPGGVFFPFLLFFFFLVAGFFFFLATGFFFVTFVFFCFFAFCSFCGSASDAIGYLLSFDLLVSATFAIGSSPCGCTAVPPLPGESSPSSVEGPSTIGGGGGSEEGSGESGPPGGGGGCEEGSGESGPPGGGVGGPPGGGGGCEEGSGDSDPPGGGLGGPPGGGVGGVGGVGAAAGLAAGVAAGVAVGFAAGVAAVDFIGGVLQICSHTIFFTALTPSSSISFCGISLNLSMNSAASCNKMPCFLLLCLIHSAP